MNEMELVPYERFGPVRFGATHEEVIAATSQADPTLTWTRRDEWETFSEILFRNHARVEFDEHGRCMHVAIFFHHEVVPVVDGDLRLTGGFEDVVDALRQRGFQTRPGPEHDPGEQLQVVCDELGLAVSREDPWEVDGLGGVAALRDDLYRQNILGEEGLA